MDRKKRNGEKEFMAMNSQTPKDLIARITEFCGAEKHVFRGEPCVYELVSSGIYRQFEKIFVDNEQFLPVNAEKENVKKARLALYSNSTSIEEILTDLRHFGGSTTLIDFSYSLHVALFFACSRDPDKDGRIIAAQINRIARSFDSKKYGEEKENSFLIPVRTSNSRARVEFQSSIFIHAPRGYIEIDNDGIFNVRIPKKLKSACLNYLDAYFNIRANTIYNDLVGYIENEKNLEMAQVHLFSGLAESHNGKFTDAIMEFDRSIKLDPYDASVWYNRGNVKHNLKLLNDAITDYDQAIELQPNFTMAWNNRGNVKMELGQYEEAMKDYDVCIGLEPKNFLYWRQRGAAKRVLGHLHDALSDYNHAIYLNPDDAVCWQQRGNTKIALEMYEEAIYDFDRAIILYPTFSLAWCGRALAKRKLGKIQDSINDLLHARNLARQEGNTDLEIEINDLLEEDD